MFKPITTHVFEHESKVDGFTVYNDNVRKIVRKVFDLKILH